MSRGLRYFRTIMRMSWVNAIAVCLLIVIGIFFIYSACYVEGHEVQSYWKKQIVWALVGIAAYITFVSIDYRSLKKLSMWAYICCMFLLLVVMFVGEKRYGATRWLKIGGILVQPAEFMKVAMLVFLARVLSGPKADVQTLRNFFICLAIVLVPFFLIVIQPDLGTAMIFLPIAFVMMFVGGIPLRYLGILLALALLGISLLLGVLILPEKMGLSEEKQDKIVKSVGLKEHQKNRIKVFLNISKDPMGAGWNKRQSQIAVGSGGAWGKGWKNGKQNILGFLPRSVAPTDFIYSVIAEEKGFFGSVVVLLLFGCIIGCGIRTALIARDKAGRLLCIGVVTMIFCHVFINIAMTVGLMPITGLPLPLISYGGSFIIVTMSALGIIQSVYVRSLPEEQRYL